jgi:deoxyribose-phosphate aldolase
MEPSSEILEQTIERLAPLVHAAVERAGAPGSPLAGAEAVGKPPRTPLGAGIAVFVDHASLKPGSTPDQSERLCTEARDYPFAGVCVNAVHDPQAVKALAGSPVKTGVTVGFPLGATTREVKALEAKQAVQAGEAEVDRVIDLGSLKAGDHVRVAQNLLAEIRPVRAAGAVVKVITEAALLTEAEKVAACLLSVGAGADFVKTPTGFGADGATENVALMRRLVGPSLGVKAGAEIRTWPTPRPCWPQVRPAWAPAPASPSFRKPLVAASLPKANGG